ncbi:MAG: PAS domain-containing hybrid sensor histidine kinase/response regulator [Chthoniobacterales bacterium]
MTTAAENAGSPVLILTPVGRDAFLAAEALAAAGFDSIICDRFDQLIDRLDENAGAVLMAKEALVESELERFRERLSAQPPWSDLPLLVLTHSGHIEEASVRILDLLGPSANVSLLERPLRSSTLISVVRVAWRARSRQYQVRELIEQREALLSSISDAFSAIDFEWRYTYVNDRVAEFVGRSKAEMIGRNIWEIFPEAVGSEFYQLAHQAMNERRPVQSEFFHKPWNRWVDTRIYPTQGGIVIFRADISERKKQELIAREAEAKLRESEDRLRLATEAAAIGTFDYFPQTGELSLSGRAQELYGLPPDAPVTYDNYLAALHPDDRHIAHETVQRVLQPGSGPRYDIEYRTVSLTNGQERWIAEKGRVVFDGDGRPSRFIGTLIDVTEQKNAEHALRRAKQDAEDANRAKDQFLAMLSHELRTPLTPVLMTIAALRRQPNLSGDLRSDLEVLQRNVELEALLIDDLLDLTRIAHGKLELHNDAVDVHTSLEHALIISKAELEAKNLTVTRRFEAREHHCWADAARLQQVFWNLVKNAAKFTPPGGRLDLSTRNDQTHQIVVEISDNGVGIEPDLLPRIFDAFEQGGRDITSQFGGLGLGLAISKRVIDLHGGTINAISPGPGQGSTFTIVLHAIETSLLDRAVNLPLETSVTASVKILLVEDHADTARVLRRILESSGYSVVHADSITKGRAIAAGEVFDLVISDLGLPDGSGLDLMRGLRATHGLTGIALSGFGTAEDVAASFAAGFNEHLTKPVDWPQLRAAIARSLAARKEKDANAVS